MTTPAQIHSPDSLSALLKGDSDEPLAVRSVPLEMLEATRLRGIFPAPGHGPLDLDAAWSSAVRAWWGMGTTWAMAATVEGGELAWRLALPRDTREGKDIVRDHLPGATWGGTTAFSSIAARLGRFPHRIAMAGHVAAGSEAGCDPAFRSLLEGNGLLLVAAVPAPRAEVEQQLRELARLEQFLREEYLARPGLERDNHAPASACLELIGASRTRAAQSLSEGGWWVRTILATADAATLQRVRGSLQGSFAPEESGLPEPVRWQPLEARRKLTFLRSGELAALTRPPRRELPGFSLAVRNRRGASRGDSAIEHELFATSSPAPSPTGSPTLGIGRVLDDGGTPRQWLELPVDDLCRHLLIAGMTGSGKSVTCEHLLLELWCEHRIPWMVIEPGMKTGYRGLLRSDLGRDLNLWSVGDPRKPRLALNPLSAPPGIALAEHTAALFAIISSAFELVAPMPEVLATAIERTYERHGWNLAGLVPHGPPPPFSALVEEVDRCSRELGYGPEVTGNIRAGLLLRLNRLLRGPLAPELVSPRGFDVGAFVSRPTVVELSALPDAASQAFVSGILALALRHHWRVAGESSRLRHVLVIEEAHRLLKSVQETAANAARVRATEDFAHLLAELRGFGVGIVLVDQTPAALIPSAIANTGTKILHRLDHPDDRELAGRSAGIPSEEVDLLGGLAVGQAILRSDRNLKPYRIALPNPTLSYLHPLPPSPDPSSGIDPAPASSSQGPAGCSVCKEPSCAASGIGGEKARLAERIQRLQEELVRGPEAAWRWAKAELAANGILQTKHGEPLCFLVSLGQSAGLSESTLTRIREGFRGFRE